MFSTKWGILQLKPQWIFSHLMQESYQNGVDTLNRILATRQEKTIEKREMRFNG